MPQRKLNDVKVAAAYRSGESTAIIAERFGVNPPAVIRALHRIGEPIRARVRRSRAQVLATMHPAMSQSALIALSAEIDGVWTAHPVRRDPCPKCGVRADKHGEFGCKRWRVR